MAAIGYSPLPPNLSQEMANAIGRMQGSAPETLTAANCANPRFRGELGADSGAPPDPIKNVVSLANKGAAASNAPSSAATAAASSGAASAAAASGVAGSTHSAGGGSGDWRDASPVLYQRPITSAHVLAPILFLVALLVIPPLLFGRSRRRRSA